MLTIAGGILLAVFILALMTVFWKEVFAMFVYSLYAAAGLLVAGVIIALGGFLYRDYPDLLVILGVIGLFFVPSLLSGKPKST